MHHRAWLRAPVVLLLLALAAGPAFAAGKAPARLQEPGFIAWLRHALGEIVPFIAEGRGTIDPDGAPTADGRGTIDPNGASTTDGRSTIDPDG
ncbi:MAG TPA: hypothetical protein VF173_11685 [Thermoanaerobaculia bacterium]|nr:hypothetical protein [Thermoanaerobaculia bacterium]